MVNFAKVTPSARCCLLFSWQFTSPPSVLPLGFCSLPSRHLRQTVGWPGAQGSHRRRGRCSGVEPVAQLRCLIVSLDLGQRFT